MLTPPVTRASNPLIYQLQTIPSIVTLESIVLAVSVSAVVGLFFGMYPALRASRLNPIEALHYE